MNRQVGAGSVKELTEAMIRPFDIGEERSTSRIRARRAAAPADTLGPQTPRYGSSMARVAATTPLDRSHQLWSGCRMVAWDTAKHARCFDPDCRNRRSGGYRAKSPIVPDSWLCREMLLGMLPLRHRPTRQVDWPFCGHHARRQNGKRSRAASRGQIGARFQSTGMLIGQLLVICLD
jgi:hypothetical protein